MFVSNKTPANKCHRKGRRESSSSNQVLDNTDSTDFRGGVTAYLENRSMTSDNLACRKFCLDTIRCTGAGMDGEESED